MEQWESVAAPIWYGRKSITIGGCYTIIFSRSAGIGYCKLVSGIIRGQNTTNYHKRWKVEEYHKSLKQNASLEKSPAKIVKTQANHLFASICAFVKLQKLTLAMNTNHFALKGKLYAQAMRVSYDCLSGIQEACK